jgi:galactokinase
MTGGGFGGCIIALVGIDDVGRVADAIDRAFAARGFTAPTTFVAEPSEAVARFEASD